MRNRRAFGALAPAMAIVTSILFAIVASAASPTADFAGRWETIRSFRGAELVGGNYNRPLDWIEYKEGKHEIIIGESFVSADEAG